MCIKVLSLWRDIYTFMQNKVKPRYNEGGHTNYINSNYPRFRVIMGSFYQPLLQKDNNVSL